MPSIAILLVIVAGLAASVPAAAQTSAPATRAEALRQEREEKQKATTPNEPDSLQRGLDWMEDVGMFLIARDGFHPKIGSLTTGSGFAFGVGYRDRDVFARHGMLELWTAGSMKRYWAMEARASFPDLAGGRVMAEAVASLREYPREAFFGLGPDSQRDDQTSFLLRTAQVSGRAGVRLAPAVLVGGGLGHLNPRTGEGEDERLPAISDRFDPAGVPGLGQNVDFLRASGFVEVDYREPKNARRGGWYRFEYSQFADQDGGAMSFRRTDLDLRQFIGFLAGRRVIALRGYVSSAVASPGGLGVPFYLMPTLGGNDTLRGFRNYRFRGPHALLLQAEYRWELWSGLEAALFYDAGKVAMRRADLDLKKLQSDYGFGFRFNTDNGVVMRVDAAFGSRDGKHLHIVFGGVF